MELWSVTLKQGKLDSEVKSRIIVCKHQMQTFSLFFGLCLGKNLYKHNDNLSKTLHCTKMCQVLTMLCLQFKRCKIHETTAILIVFSKLCWRRQKRTDSSSRLCYHERENQTQGMTTARQLETKFLASAKDDYRRKYYEALDLLISSIKTRFSQPSSWRNKIWRHYS